MSIERTQERIDQTGEVFTPPVLVTEILTKLPPAVWGVKCAKALKPEEKYFTFIDNSCGDGNFLVEILQRKLKTVDIKDALATTFGVDLMYDNVQLARKKLLAVALETAKQKASKRKHNLLYFNEDLYVDIIRRNIVCHDALEYHYKFDGTHDGVFNGHHQPGKCPDCC